MADEEILYLRGVLEAKEKEIIQLKATLADKSKPVRSTITNAETLEPMPIKNKLSNEDIARYSRQLILPELGVQGQLNLCRSSILIIGCGGLGCPAAMYLVAAGIGRIGLVDYDEVELGNLHRQVLHAECRIGRSKSQSAALGSSAINSSVDCVPYHLALNSTNALLLIEQYDIVLDCTDNVATRYLLNDACVLARKPLVSGSALKFEGQLTIYNYKGSPCYRCLYPQPPPPETVTNCSDGGVLGVVPGIIGCIQALETIKIAARIEPAYAQKLLLFDALDGTFRQIKLRPRQKQCAICGESPTITKLIDYEQFCGAKATDKEKSLDLLSRSDRINVKEYKEILDKDINHILIDVRPKVELDICQLPNKNTINIPITQIEKEESLKTLTDKLNQIDMRDSKKPCYVVCRRGNDSQIAVNSLKKYFKDKDFVIKDLKGGLHAWAKYVDTDFPVY